MRVAKDKSLREALQIDSPLKKQNTRRSTAKNVPGIKQLQLKKGNSSFSNQPGSSAKLQRKGSILGIKHQNSLADI